MTTFIDRIPDADVLLALPDQELALTVLALCQEHQQRGMIHPVAVHNLARRQPGQDGPEYPRNKQNDIDLAVDEALNWLLVQGIMLPDMDAGANGHLRISRRGQRLLSEGKFNEYAKAVAFPKSLLHPSIAEDVWLDLARGDLPTAVFKAFRSVEIAVREVGQFGDAEIGVPLTRRAFSPGGPLADPARLPAEVDALSNLFAGAIGSYKNPHSHRTVAVTDLTEAQEMVMLASHLLRIVDSRR